MSHVVHPYAHRLGILRDWKSRWFRRGKEYRDSLKNDVYIYEFLKKRLKGFYAGAVEIERSGEMLKVIIKTARPGMLIGRQGEGAAHLKEELSSYMRKRKMHVKDVRIEIEEIRFPESNARVVAQMIVEGLERRLPFRRVLKQTMDKVKANKEVKGARFAISGRLGGAEMSRSEEIKSSRLPLQTFRADVEFAREIAVLPYGTIGVKVWVYKGEKFSEKSQTRHK